VIFPQKRVSAQLLPPIDTAAASTVTAGVDQWKEIFSCPFCAVPILYHSGFKPCSGNTSGALQSLLMMDARMCWDREDAHQAEMWIHQRTFLIGASPLKKALRSLRYADFLKTNYWRAVKQVVNQRDCYECTSCGAYSDLEVHHKSYRHHGSEHLHLDDLVTLCRYCHSKISDREQLLRHLDEIR
jgi:5-methylcytosine-specific restriction endonuclease McrA